MSEINTQNQQAPAQLALVLNAHAYSVIGKRKKQEDSTLVAPNLGLFAVADGMGGHLRGADASQTAVDTLRTAIEQAGSPSTSAMRDALMSANDAVTLLDMGPCPHTRNGEHKLTCGCRAPGTTLTALWFGPRTVIVGHIGDCRAYHWTAAGLPQVITKEHRSWGGIAQFLGMQHRLPEPDVSEIEIGSGHTFLLASDGMWEPMRKVPEGEPAVLLLAVSDADLPTRTKNLIAAVADRSSDNITALLIEVS